MTLLTTAEAARIFHIPASTLRRWASEGRIRRFGTRKHRLYEYVEVEQLARPENLTRLTDRRK